MHRLLDDHGIGWLRKTRIVIDYMWSSDDDNWSTLQEIRLDPVTSDLPIVLCTGAVRQVRDLEDHLERMGIAVVLKPFRIDDLTGAIARALAPADLAESADLVEAAAVPVGYPNPVTCPSLVMLSSPCTASCRPSRTPPPSSP